VNLKNQSKLKQRALSSSSGSSTEKVKKDENPFKENQAPNNLIASQNNHPEDETLRTLIESLLQLYPEIRLKAKRIDTLQELIRKHFYPQ